jgi:hypothetical protein
MAATFGGSMSNCSQCGAALAADATSCAACGASIAQGETRHHLKWVTDLYTHIPHPHIHRRKLQAPMSVHDMHRRDSPMGRFNTFLAIKITTLVGTMWCAYAFAVLALISLPDAIHGGSATLISWIAQTFLQLVLLSIIIVGQKVAGDASDKRAMDTYNDAEAILHEAVQIQEHLAAQDAMLKKILDELAERSAGSHATPPTG